MKNQEAIEFLGAVVKNPPTSAEVQETPVQSWVRKILWRRKWQPTAVFLPGKSNGQRKVLWATVHGVTKSQT